MESPVKTVATKFVKAANITGLQPGLVKGIAMLRDRPKGTGWCGYDDCKHKSHKLFNESS